MSEKAAVRKASVCLETPSLSVIPEFVSLLATTAFEVRHADPIRSPSAIAQGKLRKFDIAIAFPPLGMRYEGDTAKKDWFTRFPERTSSGAVLSVRHLLSQASRRVVVAVPNSLLFSERTELSLRLDLVEKGMVEAVIAMPSGLLASSKVGFSILVLNPAGGSERVRFINAEAARFYDAISKAKRRLVHLTSLVELCVDHSSSDEAVTVDNEDVWIRNAQLQVSQCLTSESSKIFDSMLDDSSVVLLSELVNTARPRPTTLKKNADTLEAQEVGAADLPPFGCITKPGKSVLIDVEIADKNQDKFLRPFDIILIVKGSVGKVGIVPEQVPPPGPGGWVAGQSSMVLRRTRETIMDPRALLVQLRSPLGQELLNSIVSRASIPLITLAELDHLQVLPANQEHNKRAIVSKVGWYGDAYVLPDGAITAEGNDDEIYFHGDAQAARWEISGTTAEWREHVGSLFSGNSLLVFAASCAFAAPLPALCGGESGGFHFHNISSTGKTTLLLGAGSVLGGGSLEGFTHSWRATPNALETIASAHNDALLPLDELSQLSATEVEDVAYLLGNGVGRGRMKGGGKLGQRTTFRLLMLSTGELTMAEHAGTTGKRLRSGAEVRIVNLAADAGCGLGVFEELHGSESAAAFSDRLKENARLYYGSPFRHFLRYVVTHRELLGQELLRYQREFRAEFAPGASGTTTRVADRLSMVAFAGRIATHIGLTGWKKGEPEAAAQRLFREWVSTRDDKSSNCQLVIERLRALLSGGAPRFSLKRLGDIQIADRAGYISITRSGDREFLSRLMCSRTKSAKASLPGQSS